MRFEVRRRPGRSTVSRVLAAAFGIAVFAGGFGSSQGLADDPPPVHPVLKDFLPSGKYVLKTDAKADAKTDTKTDTKNDTKTTATPAILFSQRAAAYLVRGSSLGSPLLVRTGTSALETLEEGDLLSRDDGACDVKAGATPKAVGRFKLDGLDIVIQVPGLAARLTPSPPLLGWQRSKTLIAHSPEYGRDAKAYRIEPACLEEIRSAKGEVRVFVYFGSWCPTCILVLGRVIRLEQELAKDGGPKIQFDYYGLPSSPNTWVEPEAVAHDIDRLPSALIYVDSKCVRRIVGHELARPESALAAALSGR